MRKILSWTLSALFLAGCTAHEIETENIEYTYAASLEEASADSLLIDISLEWPVKGIPPVGMENIRNNLIAFIFGKDMTGTDIQTALARYAENETASYQENGLNFREAVLKNGDKPTEGMFSWSETMEGHFLEPYKNMQSYLIYRYEYTGGAHGMDSEKGMTFWLSDGKLVTEADLFKRDSRAELSRILSENLPKSISREVYDMLFIKTVEPNGNFCIDESGITYIYERYEIGPYVSGIVRISIPWDELKNILK